MAYSPMPPITTPYIDEFAADVEEQLVREKEEAKQMEYARGQ
eukprot:gene33747-41634_t